MHRAGTGRFSRRGIRLPGTRSSAVGQRSSPAAEPPPYAVHGRPAPQTIWEVTGGAGRSFG